MTTNPEKGKERIGVYVCHCGSNIAGIVDVEDVAIWAGKELADRGVVISRDYKFMCSSLGQELIEKDIQEEGLTLGFGCSVLPTPARKYIPNSLRAWRFKSVSLRARLDQRAGLVGPYRQSCSNCKI